MASTGGACAALDLLYRAVSDLVLGRGDIRSRIAAAGELLLAVRDDELPPALLGRFRSIRWRLTERGGVADTVETMPEEETALIAGDILGVFRDFAREAPAAESGHAAP